MIAGNHQTESMHRDICNQGYFRNNSHWITQASMIHRSFYFLSFKIQCFVYILETNLELPTTCPIIGTYKGELPADPGYCAHLHSDCDRKDIMTYQIETCHNSFEVYERKL